MTSVRSPILSSPRKRSLRHRRGVWLLGEVCGCGMRHGFGGWAGHALKGGPVKGDVRGAVGFAFVGHNTREAEGQCLVVESFMAAYKDAIAMQGETAYINMEKAAQNEFLKSGYKYVKGYKRRQQTIWTPSACGSRRESASLPSKAQISSLTSSTTGTQRLWTSGT